VAYLFVIGFLLFITLKFCLGILLPFIIGTLIAVSVQKPALMLSEKIKLKQGTIAIFMVVGVYFVLLFTAVFFGSRIYTFFVKVYEKLPEYTSSVSAILETSAGKIEEFLSRLGFENSSVIGDVTSHSLSVFSQKAIDVLSDFISIFLKKAPSFLLGILVALVSGCFIAKDFCSFKKILKYALNEKRIEFLNKIKLIIYENVFKFLKGYLLLSLITFALLLVGFLIIGIKDAVKIALITAFVDLLPVFGSGIVLVPWALICLIKGKNVLCVGLIILYLAVLVARNVLEPKIVGKQIGLHPLITLFSLFLGVKFFGVMGIFVLPLIVTVAYKYFEEKVTEKERRHSM
jgi:sporulation integral membrane protein YtvI